MRTPRSTWQRRWSQCLTGIWLATASLLPAQKETPIPLQRLSGPIVLDGLSDEPAWAAVAPFPMTMFQPTYQGTPTERSEIRVAYDDDYLYLAGRLYDSDPTGIRATSFKRDLLGWADDWFGITLDTFNDNENALAFSTTPAGIRLDLTVFNDAAGDNYNWLNASWNTFWDVAVTQNGDGWFAELRIPFSSLRFQDEEGQVVMGLSTWRSIARKNEFVTFPDVPPDWGIPGLFKPSQMQKVLLKGIKPSKPVYITPYGLGGVSQIPVLDASETAYDLEGTPTGEVGLDVKYSLTSNLTLDLTVNTDFAQVEADDEQVNLTRFSLFFPEKRLFFQERASIFDFNWGLTDRLFYSRRIGLHEEQVVPIYGGARLVGRLGEWDVGMLSMQTKETVFDKGEEPATITPSENFGVLRLRRQVINPYSYAGVLLTNRMDTDGGYNRAYGLDGIFRLFGDDYFTVNWAQTFDSEQASPDPVLDQAMLRLNWERRKQDGVGYDITFMRMGPDFDPGMGFNTRDNYTRLSGRLSYGWLPGETSRIYRHRITPVVIPFINNTTGKLESNLSGLIWNMETKAGSSLQVWPRSTYDALVDTFFVSDDEQTYVPPGNYRYFETVVTHNTIPGNRLRGTFMLTVGRYYDGWRQSVAVLPSWTISRYLNLSGYVEYNQVGFPARSQRFDALITRLRLQLTLNTAFSLVSFIQTNNAADAVIANVRLRYNPREGTDLYLVYNEGLNTDRRRESPTLPFTDNRTVLLKYSTTFLR